MEKLNNRMLLTLFWRAFVTRTSFLTNVFDGCCIQILIGIMPFLRDFAPVTTHFYNHSTASRFCFSQ